MSSSSSSSSSSYIERLLLSAPPANPPSQGPHGTPPRRRFPPRALTTQGVRAVIGKHKLAFKRINRMLGASALGETEQRAR